MPIITNAVAINTLLVPFLFWEPLWTKYLYKVPLKLFYIISINYI